MTHKEEASPGQEGTPMALEQELATYQDNLKEWSEHEGKYVLIKGKKICGFFSSYDDALQQGYEKFKLDGFFVKQIHMIEYVHCISRLVDPCHILLVK